MLEAGEITNKDLLQSLLPVGMGIISANDLLKEIQQKCGVDIAKEFTELVISNKMPEHTEELVKFFTNRKDLISINCLSKLTTSVTQ